MKIVAGWKQKCQDHSVWREQRYYIRAFNKVEPIYKFRVNLLFGAVLISFWIKGTNLYYEIIDILL